ncbi:Spermidine hydroxycinnamoyl transferase [Glycine soja]
MKSEETLKESQGTARNAAIAVGSHVSPLRALRKFKPSSTKMVAIVASYIVTPNQPTPNDPLWMSDSDQIGHLLHVSSIYIYKAKHNSHIIERMRNSLSKLLVYYYPVAGRLSLTKSGRMEVDCNAKGVTLVEAESTKRFGDYGDFSPSESTEELVPKVDYTQPIEEIPLLLLQLTRFHGGEGLAIGVVMSHPLTDAIGFVHFMNRWAKLTRGEAQEPNEIPFLDRTLLKLPHQPSAPSVKLPEWKPAPKIPGKEQTRSAALLELTSNQVQRLKEKANDQSSKEGQQQLDQIRAFFKGQGHRLNVPYAGDHNILLTSWITMPLYEADFGWGKPVLFGLATRFQEDRAAILPNPEGYGVTVSIFFQTTLMQLFKTFFYEDMYIMNSIITVLYFNGRVYEDSDGVIFEGSKKAIQIKRGISFNALKKKIGDKVKFLVSGKYVALQICDDEDVETMIEKKDVAGGSMFHAANSVTSCGRNVSHHESELPRNISNLHDDEDDDDDDYLASNSYVEESFNEDDSDDGISDTDDEVTDIVEPVSIVHPTEGVPQIQNPFWNDAMHYNNINWSHPDEEDIYGLDMPTTFNVGQELYVGMDFDSKDAVKNALKQYVMKVHQTFKVVETKSHKYIVCCPNNTEESPCPFYMRAILSKKTDAWKVTQWGGPHTCLNMTMTQDHEKLDSNLIATCVVGMIREDPSIKISLIQERINSEFSYKVSYRKAWMAKQKAIAIEYGDWEESYAKLSVSREHCQFHRVFWTFGQCKEAFKYCKPIIQVDGTHLYGKYRGTLLMATSQDGNGGVLPLAFAVVEGETLTAWSWFLAHLREHVTDKNGICLISYRHASIKSAVANEHLGWQPPHGYHVYCVRHIASNFNRKFNNAKQKKMFKKLAYTPCKHVFDQNLEKFRQLSPAIARWIDRISKEKWSMAYDTSGRRYGHMTTNLSECVNKVLKDCRSIPITALVKSTYSRCRKYFVDRGRQAQRQLREGQVYCSKLVTELRKNQEQACSHIVRVYDIHSTRFEVEETFNPITQRGGQKWAVNLNGHYCQCGRYSALHYPCSHIIAACGYVSMNYYQYIDVVYTNEHILKAYSAQWWPLGNEAAIPPSDEAWTLIPDPTTIRAKGRPKSTRIRNEMDWVEPSDHRKKCSRCGAEGHNRRRCPMQSDRGNDDEDVIAAAK